MQTLFQKLKSDERGFIVSVELILIATVLLIGLLAGMTAVRDAVTSELSDVAGAVQDLNQGYIIFGVTGHSGSTAGSDYTDELDFCDSAGDVDGNIDNCIVIAAAAAAGDFDEGAAPTAPTGP